jgi:tetratricopeptide (TPR) repeat protein
VRRAVLETMVGPPIGYYLHPILRDAVPREAEQEAAAHAAAAKWFLRRPVNPVDFTTWDDALYHLRRAAEVGRHEIYYDPYMEFMKDYTGSLEDAGWGRRVVAEDRVLDSLAQNDWEHFIARIDLGRRLKTLGELSEATQIFRELIEGIPKLPDDVPQEEEPEWLELITRGQIVAKDLLASTLAAANQLEEARRLVEEIEPVAELSQPSFDKLDYLSLRFDIARKERNPSEILRWATARFELAQYLHQQSPSRSSLSALAEAHFALAIANIREGHRNDMISHFVAQLRIYLDMDRIPGVAAALVNVGAAFTRLNDVSITGTLWLTAEQIKQEVGIVDTEEIEGVEQAITELLSNNQLIETGRSQLAIISEKLLPYFERGLARRLEEGARGK